MTRNFSVWCSIIQCICIICVCKNKKLWPILGQGQEIWRPWPRREELGCKAGSDERAIGED